MAIVSDVVTGFVTESTNSLLKAVIGRIRQEMKLVWGFKADLGDLEEKLDELDDVLSGVQPGSLGNNRVLNRWMRRAREVAYKAEDVMDEYSYELLKRKIALKNRPQRLRRFRITTRFFFSPSSNPAVLRFLMAHRVKSLKKSVNEIYVEAEKQGFKPGKIAGGKSYVSNDSAGPDNNIDVRVSLQRELPEYEMLIGRSEDKDRIMTLLHEASNSNRHLSVVGVCGMAGLGKTALCRSIFNTAEVQGEYKEQIWVCISHSFEFTQLLNRMVELVGDKQPCNTSNKEALVERLKEKMKGKKFLLVLDDVWETFRGSWEPLKVCLHDVGASKGNAVLVTSRIRNTLGSMITPSSGPEQDDWDAPCIYHLGTLSEGDSWSLFTRCVGEKNLSNPMKENMGRTMLRKCEGVPLAIKVLGALLRSQNSMSQWKQIAQDDDIWNKEDALILPSIKLSVKYLPSIQLKKCFAYCAIFKEDEVIEKNRLIQLWMAQGLLQPYDKKEQLCDEPLGEKYFHILLDYSLFLDARFDDLGKVQDCRMHDVVHNLAVNISEGDTETTGHRSLHLIGGSFDISQKEEFITKAKCLRVLSLIRVGLEELPDWIGELKHLRYLDISKNKIKCLPDGLGKLYHLQTLRIFSNSTQDGRYRMPMLPKEFAKLANLRHLCSNSSLEVPVDLGMLTSLQTLPVIDLHEHSWGGRASELGNLHNLKGELTLVGFMDAGIIDDLKKVKLGTKEKVENLVLYFADDFRMNEEDVNHVVMLEALQPHFNLAALEIWGYKSKALPKWMMEMTGHQDTPLQNLVSLSIKRCPALEQLPSMKNLSALKVLKIWNCNRATSLQNLEYLTSLRSLELCSLRSSELRSSFEMENLPDIRSLVCLEELSIKTCRKITCLPAGLSNLPNLKTLELSQLNEDMSSFPFPDLNHLSPLSTSLQKLHMDALGMHEVKNLPNQIQHLRELRSLEIRYFKNLEALPEWLGKLTSLEALTLARLPLIEHLPSQAAMECLSQLMALDVSSCLRLGKACRTPNGSEWFKIQKIHHVRFRPSCLEEVADMEFDH